MVEDGPVLQLEGVEFSYGRLQVLFGISLVATGALRRLAPVIGWDA